MIIIKHENYGADADGNRGVTMYESELEASDADWIIPQIEQQYEENKRLYAVYGWSEEHNIEVEFIVNIKEYIKDV